jgi:hypothetical protein
MRTHTRVVPLWIAVVCPAFCYMPAMENQARQPDAAEAAQILKAVCGAGAQVNDARMFCSPCPDFTSLHGLTTERFQLRFVLAGNYTKPDSADLAVFFEGCEPLADNFGGAVLLHNAGDGWKMARYDSALRPLAVRAVRQATGRDLLFFEANFIGLGLDNNSLDTFDFSQQPVTAHQTVLLVSDTTRACGLDITKATLDKVTWQEQNFTATVTWGRIKAGQEYLRDCPDKIPNVPTRTYDLHFHYDGTKFQPAGDSKATFEQVNAK